MDPGALPLIISVVVVLLLFALLRRRGTSVRHRPETVQSILYDVRLNQALVKNFHLREKPRKFETANWSVNKTKIGFLDEVFAKKCEDCGHEHGNMVERCEKCGSQKLREPLRKGLRETLSNVFAMVEDFNQQIKIARKTKAFSQLNIDVGNLKKPLDESRKGLEDWLEEHTGHRELPPKYPGFTDLLFGRR